MNIYLFKTKDPLALLDVFQEVVKSTRNGTVDWNFPKGGQPKLGSLDSVGWLATNGWISSISVDAPCADVMAAVARNLGGPELVVFFQEKSFWEFALYVDQALVIKFSTAPAQWGDVESSAYFGTPQDLADIWEVPVERIERYMVDWGLTERWIEEYQVTSPVYLMEGQKAYHEDEYEYGQLYQGFDFIRALGGHLQDEKQFLVHLPPPLRIMS